jgi:hypothetical protein
MTRILGLTVLALAAGQADAATFTPGDVYAKANAGNLYNITAGGDFTSGAPFSTVGSKTSGKPAWSADLSTMYVSDRTINCVYAISPDGNATVFASGLSRPCGLLRTSSGKLLVTENDSGEVTDISAGGDFSSVAPFASGLNGPQDLAETPSGKLFVAEVLGREISNITAGGVIGPSNILTSGLTNMLSLIPAPIGEGLFTVASGSFDFGLYSISPTGVTTTFATGRLFIGITFTPDGKLLASDNSTAVRNVAAGGDANAAPIFAQLGGIAGMAVVPIPEPASLAMLAGGLLARRARR